jgi:hypothetical protein
LGKEFVKHSLTYIGINKYRDMHTWHPSYKNLLKLIEDGGFGIVDAYWQPHWRDKVVYIHAKKLVKNKTISQ